MRTVLYRISCLLLLCCAFIFCVNAQEDADMNGYDVELGKTYMSNAPEQQQPAFDRDHQSTHQQKSQILPEHRHNHKYQTGKHLSFKTIIPAARFVHTIIFTELSVLNPAIPASYRSLFFKEINPPPPKAFSC